MHRLTLSLGRASTISFALSGLIAAGLFSCGNRDDGAGTGGPPPYNGAGDGDTNGQMPDPGTSGVLPPGSMPGNEGNPTPGGLDGNDPVSPPGDGPPIGETPPDPPVEPPQDGLPPVNPPGFAAVETLDRGVVAVVQTGAIYVGWRMFGFEYDRDQPERVTYNLYRDGALVANVADSTNFRDTGGNPQSTYSVSVVIDGLEGPRSSPVAPWQQNFLRVPLQPPSATYIAHDTTLADADGDGKYEVYMLWQPNDAKDNSQDGVTSDVFIDGVRADGTQLFRINLGPNIRAGEHYTQLVVIDGDGDGRAELAVKTAPGTRDGTGAFLRTGPAANDDDGAIFRNATGRILTGPEYYTVFSGLTGAELETVLFDVPRGDVGGWGNNETYGNRVDRFLGTAAYLDASGLPSFVIARGYYGRSTLTAWNWREGRLTRLWRFDSNDTPTDAAGRPFTNQGAHAINVANVDADPQQEIVYGAMSIDHDGRGLCSGGTNHGDALHTSDFMPERPGMETFMPAESTTMPHWTVRDSGTCAVVLQSAQTGNDVGRAVAADVVASPGAEFWASAGNALRSFNTGNTVGGPQPNSINFLIWWDADELRELQDGVTITKIGQGTLLTCAECGDNNGTKHVPNLVGDLIGDWREEVIWRELDNSALRIYTTTDVTARRIYTLMHDPQYRANISFQNVAYNQPPHPSFYIGGGMPAPPEPDIRALPPRPAP